MNSIIARVGASPAQDRLPGIFAMPPPLKIASRLVQSIGTAATGMGQRIAGSKSPLRKQPKEASGTLSALKNGMPSKPMRTGAAVPTTRREIGGNSLRRTQSAPALRTKQTAAHAPRPAQAPPSRPRNSFAPQSNHDLQQALTQSHLAASSSPRSMQEQEEADLQQALELSRADVFLPPANAEEENDQLQQALALSRADMFLPASGSHDPEDLEDAQLQQALALSRADVFMPPTSVEDAAKQLRHAEAQSLAETSPHADEAKMDANQPNGKPTPNPAPPKEMSPQDSMAASTLMQAQLQAATQRAQAYTQVGKSTMELTKN